MAKGRDHREENILSSLQVVPFEELKIGECVGGGGFGQVFKGIFCGNTIAVKKLLLKSISSELHKDFVNEATIMAKCRHPNIVEFYGVSFHSDENYLLMQYLANGSLYRLLSEREKEIPWTTRWNIASDITSGLSYLHSQNIIHRDLKSMNILLDQNFRAKITDFGLAKIKIVTTSTLTNVTRPGTIRWNAPELFQFSQAKETMKSDIWSLGMVFWEIASRRLPFSDILEDMRVMFFIAQGAKQEIPSDTPKELSEIILECWSLDSEKRPAAPSILSKLASVEQKPANSSNVNYVHLFLPTDFTKGSLPRSRPGTFLFKNNLL